jgi:uncharacterized OsmC-like protein
MTANIQPHHVTVELNTNYQFITRFDDIKGTPTLVVDEPEPIGDGAGPTAVDVLGAAVGSCLAASLAYCIRKARMPLRNLTVYVTTHVGRNGKGRSRIADIEVELAPEFGETAPGEQATSEKRCQELFEDFCIVTASVRKGIPVSVTLKDGRKTAA